jgi:CubicO group peptidase (beta-lactamase class C family)
MQRITGSEAWHRDKCERLLERELGRNPPRTGKLRQRGLRAAIAATVFLACLMLLMNRLSAGAGPTFPARTWDRIENPTTVGFAPEKLTAVGRFASERLKTDALMVIVNGRVLYQWGAADKKLFVHSVRKSFLSALYGSQVRAGRIDLDRSMKDIGIDDQPPLSDLEKRATVRDCLKARSGVYHPALAEGDDMMGIKPARDSRKPGEFWVYNNWDFNVLGTVFEKATGRTVFDALKADLAVPLQMEDYQAEDGYLMTGEKSIHPAYHFRMTARDMARFGLLMLRKGVWNGKSLIPADWIEESTRDYSDAALYGSDGYGYMWWVAKDGRKNTHLPFVHIPDGSFSARGAYGQFLLVIPDYDMVIVHRVDGTEKTRRVSTGGFGFLVRLIFEAGGKPVPPSPVQNLKLWDTFAGDYEMRPGIILTVLREGDRLFVQRTGLTKEEVLPESETVFCTVENGVRIEFIRGEDGSVERLRTTQLDRETLARRIK